VTTALLVEDDTALRRALRTSLRARGIDVVEAGTGGDAVVHAADGGIDVVFLDLGLPDRDGLDVLREVRTFSTVPVVVLTVRDDRTQKVAALDAGADDYVTKPFDVDELLARMRAVLRRAPSTASPAAVITTGDVEIDLVNRTVRVGGEPVHLTKTELLLLEVLVAHPGKLLGHAELLRRVWGRGYATETQYLRVYVANLRRKLHDDAGAPRLILTEPGIGYRWIAEAAEHGH
jgi:two-component system KDP operon response regulator KdpE